MTIGVRGYRPGPAALLLVSMWLVGLATLAFVLSLQHRVDSRRQAQVAVETMRTQMSMLPGMAFGAAPGHGSAVRDVRRELAAVEARFDRTAGRLAQLGAGNSAATIARRGGAYFAELDGILPLIAEGRIEAAGLALGRGEREGAPGYELQQALDDAGGRLGDQAGRSRLLAAVGSAAAIVLTLLAFSFALLRAVRARRRAEALARENEHLLEQSRRDAARYRGLFENANDLIATVDLDDRFTSVNAAFASALGYSAEELVGTPLADVVPSEWHDALRRASDAKLRDGLAATLHEHELLAKDGRRIAVEVASRVIEEGGRPVGIQAICRDIGERAAAERALRDAEERYRTLVERLPLVTFVHTPDISGAPTYVSPQVESVLGYTPAEWYADPGLFWKLVHPDDLELVRRGRAAGLPRSSEFRLIARDGREVWLHAELGPVFDETGRTVSVQGFWLDVTETRRAAAALQESQELYRLVVENTKDMISLFSVDGTLVFVSPSHAEVLGLRAEELLGHSGLAFVHPDDRETAAEAFASAVRGARSGPPAPVRLRHSDGRYIKVEGTATPIRGTDGRTQMVLATYRDVTDRERANELADQLRQAQKLEAIGRLAGGVAHDFNNLLTVIIGYSEVARCRTELADIQRSLAEITTAAQSATALTRQLLAFSRQQVLQPRVIDLAEVVEGCERLLRRLLGEDVALTIDLAPGLGRMEVDPSQIEQVLFNLAVNAREAMPDGGRLSIAAVDRILGEDEASAYVGLQPGRYVSIDVADTGVGMDDETRARIFEPFFTTKADGTGLGLATVHGIVTQSSGHISVETAPGAGTTFRLLFPVVANDAAGARSEPDRTDAAAPEDGRQGAARTILVVEDEDVVRSLAVEVLTRYGYRVLAAANGEEALEIAANWQGRVDLVLSDIMLPGRFGPELGDELAGLHPEAAFLYTSGYARGLMDERGLDPAHRFLAKPFTPAALASKVREVLAA